MTNIHPHGRASSPPIGARGVCDRCGFLYDLISLAWQHQWAGAEKINLRILVCDDCLDKPSEQLRTPVLPPDPLPVANPRPEPYAADENSDVIYVTGGDGSYVTGGDGTYVSGSLVPD